MRSPLPLIPLLSLAVGCATPPPAALDAEYPYSVSVDPTRGFAFAAEAPGFHALVDTAAGIEVLASGFDWSEGPVWVPTLNSVLFSDVPGNVVYRWGADTETSGGGGAGVDTFLYPSGYFAQPTITGEPGANGLHLDGDGRLLLAQHGERQVARLGLPLTEVRERGRGAVAKTDFTPLASGFAGERFNSPNDLAVLPDGRILFTDPTYGVDKTFGEDARELADEAVYLIDPTVEGGAPRRVFAGFDRPNGLGLTPAADSFFVASSAPGAPRWVLCPLPASPADSTRPCRDFADASALAGPDNPGNADGLVVLADGHLLASGPGGVLAFDRGGRHLGTIRTGRATANVTVGGPDGRDVFITADDLLLRARLLPQ